MKILKAQIYFVLPDDFEGSLNEALEEWALYKDFAVVSHESEPLKASVDSISLMANHSLGYRTIFTAEVWSESCSGTWRRDYEPVPGAVYKEKAVIK